jgi:hypothetical protein
VIEPNDFASKLNNDESGFSMTEYDAETVDFGADPTDAADAESEGHGIKGPGYMEAPAEAPDAEEVEGAARPHIPGVSEG